LARVVAFEAALPMDPSMRTHPVGAVVWMNCWIAPAGSAPSTAEGGNVPPERMRRAKAARLIAWVIRDPFRLRVNNFSDFAGNSTPIGSRLAIRHGTTGEQDGKQGD
jgi:hypothetical protein